MALTDDEEKALREELQNLKSELEVTKTKRDDLELELKKEKPTVIDKKLQADYAKSIADMQSQITAINAALGGKLDKNAKREGWAWPNFFKDE